MYISVIPLARSQSRSPSTYFVWDDFSEMLQVGYLIEIPLGNSLVLGIVSELDIMPPHHIETQDIRSIVRIIATVALLSPDMIAVIFALSERYFLLIHKVASFFLPTPLLSRLDKKNYLLQNAIPETHTPDTTVIEIHHYIDTVFSPKDIIPYLHSSTIFVFPDDIFLGFFQKTLSEYTWLSIGICPNDTTPTRRSAFWIDIFEKKYDIIFWTRRILYYNLRAYHTIIYIEDAFSQEQYSYPTKIQNLDIVKYISQTRINDIIIISSSPTIALLSLFPRAQIISKRTHQP